MFISNLVVTEMIIDTIFYWLWEKFQTAYAVSMYIMHVIEIHVIIYPSNIHSDRSYDTCNHISLVAMETSSTDYYGMWTCCVHMAIWLSNF